MASIIRRVDALPLLAFKIAPRQFDVNYRFSSISLRDQIARAQMLVRTLIEMDLVNKEDPLISNEFQLLICGAGAAGIAAAKEAEDHGVSFVLIEKGSDVPGGVLQSPAERYVSVGMYEWPHPNHSNHNYPLPSPELLGPHPKSPLGVQLGFTVPVLAKTFGTGLKATLMGDLIRWRKNFRSITHGKLPSGGGRFVTKTVLSNATKKQLRSLLKSKVSIHGVPLKSKKLPGIQLADISDSPIGPVLHFKYVIYAVGFSKEIVEYAPGKKPDGGYQHKPFWSLDDITLPCLGFGIGAQPPRVVVLGSGDGAMQDALRCLTGIKAAHPLEIWDLIMQFPVSGVALIKDSPHVQQALSEVCAVDGYTTSGAIWTHRTDIFESLDEEFKNIIRRLLAVEGTAIAGALDSLIRTDVGKITIVNRYGYFTKAYALNRFLVLLFAEVLSCSGQRHYGKFEILSGEVTKFDSIRGNRRGAKIEVMLASGALVQHTCELAIIRGGLDRDNAPTQLAGLSGIDTGRAELGRIPPPIRPVGLL